MRSDHRRSLIAPEELLLFPNPEDGESIFLNPSATEFALVRKPTRAAIKSAIARYPQLRTDAVRKELFLPSEAEPRLLSCLAITPGKKIISLSRVATALDIAPGNGYQSIVSAALNLSLEEQRECLLPIPLISLERGGGLLTSLGRSLCLPVDFIQALDQVQDPYEFIVQLIDVALSPINHETRDLVDAKLGSNSYRRAWVTPRAKEVLRLLHAAGVLLMPLNISFQTLIPSRDEARIGDPYTNALVNESILTLIDRSHYKLKPTILRDYAICARRYFFSTSIHPLEKIPFECLSEWRARFLSCVRVTADAKPAQTEKSYGRIRRGAESFATEAAAFSGAQLNRIGGNPEDLIEPRRPTGRYKGGRTKDFAWLVARNAAFQTWRGLLEEFLQFAGQNLKQLKPVIGRLARWADYLISLKEPPLRPEEVLRDRHITRLIEGIPHLTFIEYLNVNVKSESARTFAVAELNRFFVWYQELRPTDDSDEIARNFRIPIIPSIDRWEGQSAAGVTHRPALPQDRLELLKEILCQDGFAWARLESRFPTDYVLRLNRKTGAYDRTWWPGRAIAIYIILETYARSSQVRWLDSGEGDDFVVSFKGESPKYSPNPLSIRTKGRSLGALRIQVDNDGSLHLGLYFPTNKTADLFAETPAQRGHLIPWVPDGVVAAIRQILEWRQTYGEELTQPIEAIEREEEPNRSYKHKVMVYPIFLDPTRSDKKLQPLSRNRLASMYLELLRSLDEKVKESDPTARPLVLEDEMGRYRTLFDLHSLRVSGVTNMLEAGVPIEIVGRYMVGHHSMEMTAHYNKIRLKRVRSVLEKHWNDARASLLDPTHVLVSREQKYDVFQISRTTLSARDLSWRLKLDGICPGASCEEGGQKIGNVVTPVIGGRCSLCRFFLTGPKFVMGLAVTIAELLRTIHNREETIRLLRERANEEQARMQNDRAASRGGLNTLQGQLSKLMDDQRLDISDLAAKKLALEASKRMGPEATEALVSLGSAEELEIVIHPGLHIRNLQWLTLAQEVIPGYVNDDAIREMADLLEHMLAANGRVTGFGLLTRDERISAVNLMTELFLNVIASDDELVRSLEGEIRLENVFLPSGQSVGEVFDEIAKHIHATKAEKKGLNLEELRAKIGN